MRVLVTGAAGRLGRAILEQCRRRHDVVGVDLVELPPGTAAADHVDFRVGDALDPSFFRAAAAGCDAICHTAALHGGHLETHTHEQFIQANVVGADMICRAMLDLGIERIAFSSTSEVTIGRAWDASGPVVVTDHTPPCPDSIYSLSKLMAEAVYAFYSRTRCLDVSCLRYCGFGDEAAAAAGTALVSRCLDASDVAEANLRCVESGHIRCEVFYVGPISPLTGPDMVTACTDPEKVLEKHWPGSVSLLKKAGLPMTEPLWPKLDVTRLRQVTGWEPVHTFDALLSELKDRFGASR